MIHERPLHSLKLTVWYAILQFEVIDPYFFEKEGITVTVNCERYVSMLENFLQLRMEETVEEEETIPTEPLEVLILALVRTKNLISNAANLVLNKHIDSYSVRARRQVILMLGTVVLSFFLCLIPFRVFTLWIIIVPDENIQRLGPENESPDSNRSTDSHTKILKQSPVIKEDSQSRKYECAIELNENSGSDDYCKRTDSNKFNVRSNSRTNFHSSLEEDVENYGSNLQRLFDRNVPKCCNTKVEVILLHEKFIKQNNTSDQESFVCLVDPKGRNNLVFLGRYVTKESLGDKGRESP
ncbi:hypothetical protein ILUMI_10715 [Ignelater luminosus]|uniref:Uncharacterized protein n=1 Tax=Ignelater luminosus TaxID=2038154 RepID=A0A8K0D6I2_IGNLU|nr:hypothetical protein ILUMI_10715 [Ignelater luminosus]